MNGDERATTRHYPDRARMCKDVTRMAAAGWWVSVMTTLSDGSYRVEYDAGPIMSQAPGIVAR